MSERRFVFAVPFRTDHYTASANILEKSGRLRSCLLWTRRGFPGVPAERHQLFPLLGLLSYATARTLPPHQSESFRFMLHPAYDAWAASKLQPGDHVISSYGYANRCFRKARKNGGLTFLDGGNSHPSHFWDLLTEEHARWKCAYPPIAPFQHRRSLEMMEDVDYVLSPSTFVANSFLERGFREEQILPVIYPVDLSNFRPAQEERPKDRPFTIINTGGLSLRKGTPYLLEAFRLIQKKIPNARFLLTRSVTASIVEILESYKDLPIEWAEYLPERELAERLRTADLFILPSLEEGLVRTALQAMACGLPAILTPNTGANDYIIPGVNGSVVPIRDAAAIADAACEWWERIQGGHRIDVSSFADQLSFDRHRTLLIGHLSRVADGYATSGT
ncbi:MAG: glycosyltransferase [Verrucomicrobiaceae bacterium]|nr:MAG: glycosyltransferase [Verrucomicrobiaceae bacterium]